MSSRQGNQGQLALAVASTGVAAFLLAKIRRWQWQRSANAAKSQAVALSSDADILRIGYSSKKLPKQIDHIIIGSGLSGLYLAALLSKMGRTVVVLEQHYVAGGCTHSFKDKGYEFDTGVHYMGMATMFTAFMDFGAGKNGSFTFQRQGADDGSEVYNEFHAGGACQHRFRPGPRTFVNDLVAKYPDEEKQIRKFFSDAKLAGGVMGLLVAKHFMPAALWRAILKLPGPLRWALRRYVHRSLAEALTDAGIKNDMLRATISAEFGDYGMVPEKAPFFVHAGILSHYIEEGGFSPVGGSDSFAHALVPAILQAGGSVLVRAPVARIVEEHGRVVGVELQGGKGGTLRAKHSVISSAGVEVTYRKLLSEVQVQKIGGPPESLLAAEKSGGVSHHVYGFFGFEGTAEELGLPTYNVWSLPQVPGVQDSDLSGIWGSLFSSTSGTRPAFLESDEAAAASEVPAFISFPSAKDATYNQRCPGKSTAVVLTESRPEFFGQAVGPHTKRSEDYTVIKKRYETLLLNALYRHFPKLKGKVSYIDVGTPCSNEHYLGRSASYGLDQNASRFLDPTLQVSVPRTPGLYLTGQDILLGGVFPQVITAWITLAKILSPFSLDFWLLFSSFGWHTGKRLMFDRTYAPAHP